MGARVLIVEDERAIADTLIYVLGTEGFEPHWCRTGEEALTALRSGPSAAFVILDVGLPDLSGFEVCRRLRTFSEVPVLFLTARSDEVDRIVGLEIGADDYVTKPFSPREVAARVRTILRRSAPRPASGLQLDPSSRRATWHGVNLDLTRYEFDLLRTLQAHPGRVHTRLDLMESVWAGSEDTTDRTVDTHIKTLRAKLRSASPDTDPIQTHRGLGYSWGA